MAQFVRRGVRAKRDKIFEHLRGLLGEEAVSVSKEVAAQYIAGEQEAALKLLKKYDATLGGVGIYRSGGLKLPGIYRALSYTEIPMLHGGAAESGRSMIQSACAHLEALIKKLVRLWPREFIEVNKLPLGTLVKRLEKDLPPELAQELSWLNQSVYVFAKHEYDMALEREYNNQEPVHYFVLEEAIAVYLIVRVLGGKLEALSGKPRAVFLKD